MSLGRLPVVPDRLPVLLQRTPYGKDMGAVNFALLSATRGYVAAVQDTRGRWASDGVHYPQLVEFEDGYDSVEWAAAQPWATGSLPSWTIRRGAGAAANAGAPSTRSN